MALTSTTLASACGASDKQIVVASATGFAAGNLILVDREVMRVSKEYISGTTIPLDARGFDGTAQVAHSSATLVTTGLGSDFTDPAAGALGGNLFASQKPLVVTYYTAAGAITPPPAGSDGLAVIVGTGALAMTLAVPTRIQDGSRLAITNAGTAAHTVTVTGGAGGVGATADVYTFKADQRQALEFIAANLTWNQFGVVAGAATVAGVGVA